MIEITSLKSFVTCAVQVLSIVVGVNASSSVISNFADNTTFSNCHTMKHHVSNVTLSMEYDNGISMIEITCLKSFMTCLGNQVCQELWNNVQFMFSV